MPTIKKKKRESKEQLHIENVAPKKKTTSKSCWTGFERVVAKFFGSVRTPLSGISSRHNTNSDSLSPFFYIECKLRQSFSLWSLFVDTEKKAKVEKKLPIVAIKEKSKEGFLVIMRPSDIIATAKILEKMQEENKE